MQLISSRNVPFIDSQTLELGHAKEALFRDKARGFILYLSNGQPSSNSDERVVFLSLREALIWLNEPSEDWGSFWA
jgi:hypothetical protein